MPRVVALLCSRLPQVATLALISFAFAGCSADMSTRVSQPQPQSQDPFSNPFNSRSEATGAVPAPQVERREYPQYGRPQPYPSSALPPPISTPQSYPAASGGVSGGGRGLASYAPPTYAPPPQPSYAQPPQPRLETTGAVPSRSVAAALPHPPAPAPATVAQGGTTIIV